MHACQRCAVLRPLSVAAAQYWIAAICHAGVSLFGSLSEGAKFVGADLTNADLESGNFEGADFTNANLSGAFVNNAQFQVSTAAVRQTEPMRTLTAMAIACVEQCIAVLSSTKQLANRHVVWIC